MSQKKAGIILSYAVEGVKIVTSVLYTPIMLRLLGESEYGLYQLISSFVSYLGLLSLGFGGSYMRFYARAKAEKKDEEIARLNGMFMTVFSIIAFICILCGIVMVQNIRKIFGTGLTDEEYHTAKILMCFLIINMAITFPNTVFNCNITAHERFIFQKILLMIQSLLNPLITLPLLFLGYGSIGMVSIGVLLTFGVLLSNMYFCLRKLQMKFIFWGFRFSLLKEMWFFTFFLFLNQIIDMMNNCVDMFLLGRMLGTVPVAVYGLAGQINGMYISFSTSVSNVFVPRVNQIVAETNSNRELSDLFIKIGRIQFMILALIVTGFIFFGKTFIKFWSGPGYEESYYVALWLIVPITIPLTQNLGIEIQRAKNMHQARSIVYFIIACANVIISIPLIRLYGPVGAAVGTAVALTIGHIIFMNIYYQKKIGLNILLFWMNILKMMPFLIIPLIYGIVVSVFAKIDSLVFMCIHITIYSFIYFLSLWFGGMNADEKGIIKAFFNKLFGIISREK